MSSSRQHTRNILALHVLGCQCVYFIGPTSTNGICGNALVGVIFRHSIQLLALLYSEESSLEDIIFGADDLHFEILPGDDVKAPKAGPVKSTIHER
eukprot:3727772-Ditylum_brightwellii.AAC.2